MDYARAVALAQRLITKNGRAITVQQLGSIPADVTKPWKGAANPTVVNSVETVGVFVPHAGSEDLGKFLVDEELLKRVEQVVLIAGGGTDLTTYQQVLDEGSVWKIDWIRGLKPGSVTVLYAVGVKR